MGLFDNLLQGVTGGDLLNFGGSVASSFLGNKAQQETTQANLAESQRREELLKGGQVDAFGNVINKLDPTTGSFTTTLAPGTQTLADQLLATQTDVARTRGDVGGTASNLLNEFSGFTAGGGAPGFSLEDARGIIGADNDLIKNAILNPALSDAAALDVRRLGGTSNEGNITSRFMERILPQINLGGEREALALKATQDDRFIRNALGLGGDALNIAAGGQQVQLPGVLGTGELANVLNAVPRVSAPTDFGTSILASGISDLGASINANREREAAEAQFQQLLTALTGGGNNAFAGTVVP